MHWAAGAYRRRLLVSTPCAADFRRRRARFAGAWHRFFGEFFVRFKGARVPSSSPSGPCALPRDTTRLTLRTATPLQTRRRRTCFGCCRRPGGPSSRRPAWASARARWPASRPSRRRPRRAWLSTSARSKMGSTRAEPRARRSPAAPVRCCCCFAPSRFHEGASPPARATCHGAHEQSLALTDFPCSLRGAPGARKARVASRARQGRRLAPCSGPSVRSRRCGPLVRPPISPRAQPSPLDPLRLDLTHCTPPLPAAQDRVRAQDLRPRASCVCPRTLDSPPHSSSPWSLDLPSFRTNL